MHISSTKVDFEPADIARWTAMVERILKGATPDSLDRRDEDGLVIHALYQVPDQVPDQATASPFYLPAAPQTRLAEGWQVIQTVTPDMDNAEILESLASGATGLALTTGDAGALEVQLDGVVLPAVGLSLDGAAATPLHYRRLLALAGDGAARTRIDLGLNPVDGFAAAMELDADSPAPHRLILSDGWTAHNKGVSAAQEIGLVTAGCAAVLRDADAAGRDMARMAARIAARLALPADMFAGIVVCRAMRRLWDGLLAGCGIDPMPLPIRGQASLRMMSVLDAEVNMLRMTTALLGGAIGGADAMAGFGHDVLTGESAGARRIARLAQVMMMAESHLQASLDPAAGAPFIESRTAGLAAAGWRCFQQIEQAGGLAAARKSGLIDEWADNAATARESSLRKGDTRILGVTLQPRSEMVSAVLPAFADVRRPAALVEDIRRAASQNTPRLLILRSAEAAGEDAIRRHLAIAGLDAVTLPQGDAGIDAARPNWVIGCGVDAPPASLPAARFIKGEDLLRADDRLALLAMLAGARGAE